MIPFHKIGAKLLLILTIIYFGSSPTQAQGVVTVAPQLVEFEGRDRAATLLLLNRGTETGLYRLQLVNRRMTADGGFEAVEEEGPNLRFASPYLRYAPRQIMLPPGEPQSVRILARVPGDLPDGEYRSHLLIQHVPESDEEATAPDSEDAMSFELRPVFGTTIPIFIRRGDLEAHAALEVEGVERDEDGNPLVHLKILREGNRHLRGDIRITDREGTVLGSLTKLAVYTTTPHRTLTVSLNVPEDMNPENIVIEMVDQDDGSVMASTTAILPPS